MAEPVNEVMVGVGEIVARIRNVYRAQVAGLPDLKDPGRVPSRFLGWLGSNVGLDSAVPLARALGTIDPADIAIWRRVIPQAVRLWQSKGTHEGYRNALRAVTGARAWHGDWFSLRDVTDSGLVPAFLTGDPSDPLDSGAYRQQVHVEDIGGTLDRELAVLALAMVRQAMERVDVSFVHFVEFWADGLVRWTDAGTVAVLDGDDNLSIGPGASSIAMDMGTIPESWTHAVHTAVLSLTGATTGVASFRFHDDGAGAYYEVELNPAGTLRLLRDGVSVATGSFGLPVNRVVLLRVYVWPNVNGTAVSVELDGATIAYYDDTTPRPPAGISWRVAAGTTVLALAYYEVSPGNPEIVTMGGP